MQNNESRFTKNNNKKKRKAKSEVKRVKHLRNNHDGNSLDSFVGKDNQDKIFDKGFSKDDFLELTKKWKNENLEN